MLTRTDRLEIRAVAQGEERAILPFETRLVFSRSLDVGIRLGAGTGFDVNLPAEVVASAAAADVVVEFASQLS
jgi:hypothetical protein